MKPYLVRMLSVFFVCALFSSMGQAMAQPVDKTSSAKRPLRVAVSNDLVPYYYIDKGKPTGLVVDVWQLWGEKNNRQIQFVASDWESSLQNVSQGNADVHSGLAMNQDRIDKFDFGHDIYSAPVQIYVHKDLQMVSSVEELEPYLMGVVRDTNLSQFVLDKNPKISLRYYESWEDLLSGIYQGEVKTFVSYDFFLFRYKDFKRINDLFPSYKSLKVDEVKTQLAVKKGNIPLLNELNAGFLNVTAEERQVLDDKWLSVGQSDNALLLSLSVGAEPFMGVNADGREIGLFVDIWKLWSNKTKTKVRFVPNSLSMSVKTLQEGKTDIHIGYPESMSTNTGLPRARHIYSTFSNLFVYDHYDKEKSVEQLNGKVIGMFFDAPYQEQFVASYPDIKVKYLNSLDEAINDAIEGQIAGFVTATQVTQQRLNENNINERFTKVNEVEYESKVYALVNPNQKSLIKKINDGFDLITEQELAEIENRWIGDVQARYFGAKRSKFQLTSDEKKWLNENPKMNVAIVEDWKPYEFVDEEGNISGISRDMFDLASKLTGQEYNFKVYPTWDELFHDFKQGNVEIVANITASDERRAFAHFTTAYWRTPWSVITHKSVDNVSSIKEFYGKRIAIIQGYQIIKEIHEKHPQIIIHVVKDFEEAQELLRAGIIDGILDLMTVSAQYIQDNALYQFKIHVFEDLGSDNAHIGIRKDLTVQGRILEKVVQSMSESDIESILKKWATVDVVAGIKTEIYWRNITIAIGLASVIILIILIWNRRLKSEILLRQVAEEKLKHLASHDPMTGLPNRSLLIDRLKQAMSHHSRNNKTIAILFLDLDGFKQVNDSFGHDVGDELLIQISERLKRVGRNSDTIARFGGDEFVMVATNLDEAHLASNVADKIITELSNPFVLSRVTVNVGVSIGISRYPQDGFDATTLIKAADDAMYVVKSSGKNNYMFAAQAS